MRMEGGIRTLVHCLCRLFRGEVKEEKKKRKGRGACMARALPNSTTASLITHPVQSIAVGVRKKTRPRVRPIGLHWIGWFASHASPFFAPLCLLVLPFFYTMFSFQLLRHVFHLEWTTTLSFSPQFSVTKPLFISSTGDTWRRLRTEKRRMEGGRLAPRSQTGYAAFCLGSPGHQTNQPILPYPAYATDHPDINPFNRSKLVYSDIMTCNVCS